jgi:hypothetical protein
MPTAPPGADHVPGGASRGQTMLLRDKAKHEAATSQAAITGRLLIFISILLALLMAALHHNGLLSSLS